MDLLGQTTQYTRGNFLWNRSAIYRFAQLRGPYEGSQTRDLVSRKQPNKWLTA